MAHDVFISYSIKDRLLAEALCHKLEEDRIRCWIAPRDISPGGSWAGEIADAIPGSRVMILVFSANANSSKQVLREVELAINHNLVIIPMKIEDVTPTGGMSYYLSTTHWIDAIGNKFDSRINTLSHRIQTMLGIVDSPLPEISEPDTTSKITDINKEFPKTKPLKKKKQSPSKGKSTLAPRKGKKKWIFAVTIVTLSIMLILGYFALTSWFPGLFSGTSENSEEPTQTSSPWKTIPNITAAPALPGIDSHYISYDPQDFDYDPGKIIYFDDSELENVILQTLESIGLPAEGKITVADMFNLKTLVVVPSYYGGYVINENEIGLPIKLINNSNISSLNGLQYAKNLMVLQISGNNINDLQPLEELVNISILILESNIITDLEPLSGLINLQSLNLENNDIYNIEDICALDLNDLVLSSNPVSDIACLENISTLNQLNLDGVSISSFSYFNNLTNLQYLSLINTEIIDFDSIGSLISLKGLDLRGSQITDIGPLINLVNLEHLFLSDNSIDNISGLEKLKKLELLDLSLETHYKNSFTIHELAENNCRILLNLIDSQLPEAYGLDPFEVVHFEDNQLKQLLKSIFNDMGLPIGEDITIKDMIYLNALSFNPGNTESYDVIMYKDYAELTVYHLNLDNITSLEGLQYAKNLKYLSINDYPGFDINQLSQLTELRYLFLNNCGIVTLDFLNDLSYLEHLGLNCNNINDITGIQNLNNLFDLGLHDNQLEDISGLSTLINLRSLGLSINNITDIGPLGSLTQLEGLDLNENNISDLSVFSNLNLIVNLNLGGNPIENLSVLENLEYIKELTIDTSVYESNIETVDKLMDNGCTVIKYDVFH